MSQILNKLMALPVETKMYILQTLPTHLASAQSMERLSRVLTTFDFLQTKIELLGTAALIADYSLLVDEALQGIQNALRLSAHVITRKPSHLAGQLLGRLLGEEDDNIRSLLEQARDYRGEPWLRPLSASLETAQGPLVYTFDGHAATVRAVAFVPGLAQLVSASSDNLVKVWDLENGQELFSLEGHTDPVYALAVSPDGKWAVSGSNDTTVQLWNLETGRNLGILGKHQSAVKGVAISPDGKRIVSISFDRSIVWDVGKRTNLSERAGYSGYHAPSAFLGDGRRIVLPSENNGLLLWDPETGEEHPWVQSKGPSSNILSIARSQDNHWIASSTNEGKISLWDVERECEVSRLGEQQFMINQAVFMPGGKHVLAASDDNLLTLWDWESQQNLGSFRESMEGIKAVMVDKDGRFVATGSSDRTVRVWDLNKLVKVMTDPTQKRSPVNEIWTLGTRAAARSGQGDLTIWDTTNGDKIGAFAGCRLVGGFNGGDFLILLSETEGLQIYDTVQHAVSDKLPGKPPAAVTGQGCLISARDGAGLQILDLITRQKEVILDEPDSIVECLALDKAGRFVLAIVHSTKNSRFALGVIWDLSNRREIGHERFHKEWVEKVYFSPDGKFAIFGDTNGRVLVWENPILAEKKPWYRKLIGKRRWLKGHKRSITGMLLSQDGDTLITAADDRSLRAWSLSAKKSPHRITIPGKSQVAITENGERAIVFTDSWGKLAVWDTCQGKQLLEYTNNHLPRLVRLESTDGKGVIQPTRFFVIDYELHMSKGAFSPEFSLVVLDPDKGEAFLSFEGDAIWTEAAVTADGKRIIAGDLVGRVHIFEVVG